MKRTMMLLSIFLVFWNVENFFEVDPDGASRWTARRFYAKCNAIAKVMCIAADEIGQMPDLIALEEVGSLKVVRALLYSTALCRTDYGIIHYESPDKRGIDCALLYRKSRFSNVRSKPCHLYGPDGGILDTRDILLFDSDSLGILVNHHPSKVGAGAGSRRELAMRRMKFLCDSLEASGCPGIACVGDFNDTPSAWSDSLLSPSLTEVLPSSGGLGTIKYNGSWELIDRCFVSPGLKAESRILSYPMLTTKDPAFGGKKPLRTYSGPRYLGGVSDHYPVLVRIDAD